MYACKRQGKASVVNQCVRFQLLVCPFDTLRLPGLSVIEAPRSVLGWGVPLMSTPPFPLLR